MKKVELHMHTMPVSVCARVTNEQAVARYKEHGYQGLMLANHYTDACCQVNGISREKWMELYIAQLHEFEKVCADNGMDGYWGVEVSLFAPYSQVMTSKYDMDFLKRNYADYLLIGADEKFLRETPYICDLDQKDLYALCQQYGILLIQAHPMRACQGHTLRDIKYLDGVEINTNFGHMVLRGEVSHEQELLQIAKENDLIVTVGGDIHGDHPEWDMLCGATYFPDEVKTSRDIAEHLRKVRVPQYEITFPEGYH